ncbi:hypothetical protein [Trinickia mobilis]|uniref:hypothetical protein n=1 Tax=Trinickia mobilis TaxID=2816356 RepID=UPI001A8C4F25|nr:hypothetical protein [Trinickia mobilis]
MLDSKKAVVGLPALKTAQEAGTLARLALIGQVAGRLARRRPGDGERACVPVDNSVKNFIRKRPGGWKIKPFIGNCFGPTNIKSLYINDLRRAR